MAADRWPANKRAERTADKVGWHGDLTHGRLMPRGGNIILNAPGM
jgi:hypothetical protein